MRYKIANVDGVPQLQGGEEDPPKQYRQDGNTMAPISKVDELLGAIAGGARREEGQRRQFESDHRDIAGAGLHTAGFGENTDPARFDAIQKLKKALPEGKRARVKIAGKDYFIWKEDGRIRQAPADNGPLSYKYTDRDGREAEGEFYPAEDFNLEDVL